MTKNKDKECADCHKLFKHLNLHHDPPRSRRFMRDALHERTSVWYSEGYFIDRGGVKRKVKGNIRNRKLCRECHKKADRTWGLRQPRIIKKLKRKELLK